MPIRQRWGYTINTYFCPHKQDLFMATLQIIGKDAHYPIEFSQIGIGRVYDNEIAIDDESISAYHALITVEPCATNKQNNNEYIIEDLESTNKTFVNGQAISRHKLQDGDIIRVGETRVKFSLNEYVSANKDFQKTKKLNQKTVANYLLKK